MKLKKLFKLIPDEYKIGITDYAEDIMFVSYGTKEEAVMGFAVYYCFLKGCIAWNI